MFELKKLSESAIDEALEKAHRYRLLNEPASAESICRDVLAIDPDNQRALEYLLLALTDRFSEVQHGRLQEAQEIAARLSGQYDREYYAGIICERWAKSILRRSSPGSGSVAYEWLRRAMDCYERAEQLRPPGHDDAMLRWNTCARIIMANPRIRAEETTTAPLELE